MKDLPDYKELSQDFNRSQFMLDPSQVHGLISGILCGNLKNEDLWKKVIEDQNQSEEIHSLLQIIYDDSKKKLKEFLFDFNLILPADSQKLSERAEALTLWCQGFITGLKFANAKIEEKNSKEMTEALNDIIEIAKLNYEDVIENEEDENAYMELVEYVRMAVIFLYQEFHDQPPGKPPSNKQIH